MLSLLPRVNGAFAVKQRKICIAAAVSRVFGLRRIMKKIKEILAVLLLLQMVLLLFTPLGFSLEICVGKDGNWDITPVFCSPDVSAPNPKSAACIVNEQYECERIRIGCIGDTDCAISTITVPVRAATLLAHKVALYDALPTPIIQFPAFASFSSDHPSPHLTLLQTVNLLI